MERYIKYCKWIGTFVLLLIPCIGFAAGLISDTLQKMTFTPPSDDLSVKLLGELFGYVPGISQLEAAGITILGPIFTVFNAGLLGLAGVFLGYTIFKTITETTMDGEAMGKKGALTLWSTVRVATGTALLIPQASGYSIINTIVMWVVIQSIGLADITWNNALEYLKKGAPVTAVAQKPWVDYSLIDDDVTSGQVKVKEIDDAKKSFNIGSTDVLRSLVCSYTIKNALIEKQKRNGSSAPRNIKGFSIYKDIEAKGEPASSSVYSSYTGGFYQFPYVEGEKADASGYLLPFSNENINIAASKVSAVTGVCGTIGYTLSRADFPSGEAYDKDYTEKSAIYLSAKKAGLQNMIDLLEPIAERLVNQAKPDADGKRKLDPDSYVLKGEGSSAKRFSSTQSKDGKYQDVNLQYKTFYEGGNQDGLVKDTGGVNWPMGASEILDAAASYQIALAAARSGKNAEKTKEEIDKTYEEAKKKGWIMAGSYYRLLLQATKLSTVDAKLYRLTGYTANGVRSLNEDEANSLRGIKPTASPFFSLLAGNLINLFSEIDGQNSNTDIETLNRALAWVYYSYPYAKIMGKSLSIGLPKQDIDSAKSWDVWATNLSAIRGKLYGGAILLGSLALAPVGMVLIVGVPMEFLWHDINAIMKQWNYLMGSNSPVTDPIVKLQLLGEQIITSCTDYLSQMKEFFMVTSLSYMVNAIIQTAISWAVAGGSFMGATVGASAATAATLQAITGVNEIARTVIYIYLPMGLAVVGPLFVTGITLAVYVPFIPYLLFLFGIISWFISIVVLMAAAPIICFLMLWTAASHEHLLLTFEAEHFVMQMIAIFFRPTLMIIGLIVGVVLARIGVDVLNLGFNVLAINLLTDKGGNIRMIEQIGIVVIYTFTMVSVVNLCLSTIHVLYNQVMSVARIQVVGAGMEERALGEVQAAGMKFGEAGVAGAKGEVEAMKDLGGAGVKGRVLEPPPREKKPDKEVTAK